MWVFFTKGICWVRPRLDLITWESVHRVRWSHTHSRSRVGGNGNADITIWHKHSPLIDWLIAYCCTYVCIPRGNSWLSLNCLQSAAFWRAVDFADDVAGCTDQYYFRELANSLDTRLLCSMLSLGREDSIESLHPLEYFGRWFAFWW